MLTHVTSLSPLPPKIQHKYERQAASAGEERALCWLTWSRTSPVLDLNRNPVVYKSHSNRPRSIKQCPCQHATLIPSAGACLCIFPLFCQWSVIWFHHFSGELFTLSLLCPWTHCSLTTQSVRPAQIKVSLRHPPGFQFLLTMYFARQCILLLLQFLLLYSWVFKCQQGCNLGFHFEQGSHQDYWHHSIWCWSLLLLLAALWSWISQLTTWSLSFLICKMGMLIVLVL